LVFLLVFRRPRKVQLDLEEEIGIDFKEAIFGATREIEVEHFIKCPRCQGTGLEPGAKFITCETCGGRGVITKIRRTFFGSFRTETVCPKCNGQGKIPERKCRDCQGQGRIKKKEKIKVKIPAGINNQQVIRIKRAGDAGKNGLVGDLYLRVIVRPDKHFKRQGDDIFSQEEISISQAVLGDKIKVQTPDGQVLLKIPAGTSDGQEFRLRNKGAYHLGSSGRGNQIIKIKIRVPKSLTSKQKKLFQDLAKQGL